MHDDDDDDEYVRSNNLIESARSTTSYIQFIIESDHDFDWIAVFGYCNCLRRI